MKLLKKTISILLCTIIIISSVCFAADAAKDSYKHNPQIYVGGLGCAPVYYEDDPDKTSMFYPLDFGRIIGNLKNVGTYLKKAVDNKDTNLLYTVVYEWLWDCFGMISLGTDGETIAEGITVDDITLKYEGNGKYAFDYDSRLDPVAVAHKLHEYIGWVQKDSGKKKNRARRFKLWHNRCYGLSQ